MQWIIDQYKWTLGSWSLASAWQKNYTAKLVQSNSSPNPALKYRCFRGNFQITFTYVTCLQRKLFPSYLLVCEQLLVRSMKSGVISKIHPFKFIPQSGTSWTFSFPMYRPNSLLTSLSRIDFIVWVSLRPEFRWVLFSSAWR